MEADDYRQEQQMVEHNQLSCEMAAQNFYRKMLDATWTRYSTYY
jgi:hypothetical protein